MNFELRRREIVAYDDGDWAEWAEFSESVRLETAPHTERVDAHEGATQWCALARLPFVRARFAEARSDDHLIGHAYCGECQRPTQVLVDMNVAVAPPWRRRYVATRLVSLLLVGAAPNGLVNSGTTTAGGAAFAEALGMKLGLTQEHYRLDLSRVDRASLRRLARVRDGYELLRWYDRCPDELLEPFVELSSVMQSAPNGELEAPATITLTADELRSSEQAAAASGLRRWTVVARHMGSGDLVGLHEVSFTPRGLVANVVDTGVVPEHRGRGIGTAMKARMTLRLVEQPGLRSVTTATAVENAAMKSVNQVLGYEKTGVRRVYQGHVDQMLQTLSTRDEGPDLTTGPAA